MADFSAAAPMEPEKQGNYLHDMDNRPDPPPSRTPELIRRYSPVLLALLFTFGFTAVAFQTRDSWQSHRDWVVPVTIPLLALAGLALAHLVARREWLAALPGFTLLLLSAVLMGINIWVGAAGDGQDGARTFLAITGGITLGLAVVALAAGLIWVEATKPTRVPESVPE